MLNISQKQLLDKMYLLHLEMLRTVFKNPQLKHLSDWLECNSYGDENFIQRMYITSKRDKITELRSEFSGAIRLHTYNYSQINNEIKSLFSEEVVSKLKFPSINFEDYVHYSDSNTSAKNTNWYDNNDKLINHLSQTLERMFNNLLENFEIIQEYFISLDNEDMDFFSNVTKQKV